MGSTKNFRLIIFITAWAIGCSAMIFAGSLPVYSPYTGEIMAGGFPFEAILIFCGIITVESLCVWIIIRPNTYSRSWIRALFASTTVGVIAAFWYYGIGTHIPLWYVYHFIWIFVIFCVLVLLFCFSGIAVLNHRITKR
jgi:hypothetical protein